jgi:hypothetical protein
MEGILIVAGWRIKRTHRALVAAVSRELTQIGPVNRYDAKSTTSDFDRRRMHMAADSAHEDRQH